MLPDKDRYQQMLNSKKFLEMKEKYQLKYIGHGVHACAFYSTTRGDVIKVCLKTIPYFQFFPNHNAEQFKMYINKLDPAILPIKEILFEDQNFFIYAQDLCEKKQIYHSHILTLFEITRFLLEKNRLICDLVEQNIGFFRQRLVLYDFHDVIPIFEDLSAIDNSKSSVYQPLHYRKWARLLRNLACCLCLIYAPRKKNQYYKLLDKNSDKFDIKIINKLNNQGLLPKFFFELFIYILTEVNVGNPISKVKVLKSFDRLTEIVRKKKTDLEKKKLMLERKKLMLKGK